MFVHPSKDSVRRYWLRTNASHNLQDLWYTSLDYIRRQFLELYLTSHCRGQLSKECKVHHFFINRSAFPIPRGLCRDIEDQGVILLEDVCQLDWIGAGRFAARHPHPTSKALSHNASAETKATVTCQRGLVAIGFKSCKTCWTSFLIYHRFWYCSQARKVYLSVDSGRIEDMVHMAAPWYIRYPTQRTPEQ